MTFVGSTSLERMNYWECTFSWIVSSGIHESIYIKEWWPTYISSVSHIESSFKPRERHVCLTQLYWSYLIEDKCCQSQATMKMWALSSFQMSRDRSIWNYTGKKFLLTMRDLNFFYQFCTTCVLEALIRCKVTPNHFQALQQDIDSAPFRDRAETSIDFMSMVQWNISASHGRAACIFSAVSKVILENVYCVL